MPYQPPHQSYYRYRMLRWWDQNQWWVQIAAPCIICLGVVGSLLIHWDNQRKSELSGKYMESMYETWWKNPPKIDPDMDEKTAVCRVIRMKQNDPTMPIPYKKKQLIVKHWEWLITGMNSDEIQRLHDLLEGKKTDPKEDVDLDVKKFNAPWGGSVSTDGMVKNDPEIEKSKPMPEDMSDAKKSTESPSDNQSSDDDKSSDGAKSLDDAKSEVKSSSTDTSKMNTSETKAELIPDKSSSKDSDKDSNNSSEKISDKDSGSSGEKTTQKEPQDDTYVQDEINLPTDISLPAVVPHISGVSVSIPPTAGTESDEIILPTDISEESAQSQSEVALPGISEVILPGMPEKNADSEKSAFQQETTDKDQSLDLPVLPGMEKANPDKKVKTASTEKPKSNKSDPKAVDPKKFIPSTWKKSHFVL